MMRRPAAELRRAAARRRRERWAQRYRPAEIDLLLVAEGPPGALERYFYFPDVTTQDSLFREVAALVLRRPIILSGKAEALTGLQERGTFLIDAVQEPLVGKPVVDISRLASRIRKLRPRRVVVVKATVFDQVFRGLRERGLPVIDERIPFPGSGQQVRFRVAFRRALRRIPPPVDYGALR